MLDTFLREREVKQKTGIPRSQRYRMMASGEFPRPVKISERCVAWSAAEIEKWQQERIARRDLEDT